MENNIDQTFAEKLRGLYKKYEEVYNSYRKSGLVGDDSWYARGGMEAIKNVVEMYCSGDFRQEHTLCPYRKITTDTDTGSIEDFGECYGKECPFFVAGRCRREK